MAMLMSVKLMLSSCITANRVVISFVAQVTILANKAFPNDPVMADTMAIEYFLKGCKHQEAAKPVIGSDRCKSLEEVSIEVRRLVDKFLFLNGSKDPV